MRRELQPRHGGEHKAKKVPVGWLPPLSRSRGPNMIREKNTVPRSVASLLCRPFLVHTSIISLFASQKNICTVATHGHMCLTSYKCKHNEEGEEEALSQVMGQFGQAHRKIREIERLSYGLGETEKKSTWPFRLYGENK